MEYKLTITVKYEKDIFTAEYEDESLQDLLKMINFYDDIVKIEIRRSDYDDRTRN